MKTVRICSTSTFPQIISGNGKEDLMIIFDDNRIEYSATCNNNLCSNALFSIRNFHSVTVDGRGASLVNHTIYPSFAFQNIELLRVSSLKTDCAANSGDVISAVKCGAITLDRLDMSGAVCAFHIKSCASIKISDSIFSDISSKRGAGAATEIYGCTDYISVSRCQFLRILSNAVSIIPISGQEAPEIALTANNMSSVGGQGFRVTTRGPLEINENVLITSGCAVRLAADMPLDNDFSFDEQNDGENGMKNITIENNHFKNCATKSDTHAVVLRSPFPPLKNLRLHRTLILRDNYFDSYGVISNDNPSLIQGAGILYAVACSDILISGNGFTLSDDYPPKSWEIAPIVALACDGIRVAESV